MPFTQLSHFGNNFLTRFLANWVWKTDEVHIGIMPFEAKPQGFLQSFSGVSLDVDIRKVLVIQCQGADACIIFKYYQIFMNILALCTRILYGSC